MTASIIFYVLFSALGYGLVFIVLKTVSIKAHPNNIRFFNYVLEISNLPKDTEIDNMYDKVYFVLEKDFGESLLGVYVVPNLANSYVADLNLNYAQEKLEHFKEYLTSHGSREQVRTGILTKVDAIYYYETLVEKYKEEYKENLKDKKKGNSGFAYVTFRTADKAEKAKRYILSRKEKWIVKKAPAPEDIKWENMGEDFEIVKKQRILLTIFFIVLFFILATPAGFLYLVDEALASFNGEEFVHGLFGNYFPTIILLFYQAVIMNYSVKYIVSKEQRTNNSVETTSRLIKYMLFMGFYVFLLQALGTQTLVSMTLEGFWAS